MAKVSDVRLKQFEITERDALLSFLQIAYSNEPFKYDPAYWAWHYLDNPYTSPASIPLWIAKHDHKVVGQAATILVELRVGRETRRAVWILDFVLLPEYRGQKIGKRLLLLARETYPTMLALGYNQMSEIWILLTCLLLIFYAGTLVKTNQTWREAAQLSRSILEGIVNLSTREKVLLLNVPDNLRGAYVYRNGLVEATKSFQEEKKIIHAGAVAFHRLETSSDEVTMRHENGTYVLQLADSRTAFESVDLRHPCVRILDRSRETLRIRFAECAGFDTFLISEGQVRNLASPR